jgi:hypothetical protein
MLREMAIPIIIFLGLLAGVGLGGVCREEVVSGRRWLLLLKKALYLLLVGVAFFYHQAPWQMAVILALGGMGYLLLNYRSIYAVLGLAFGLLAFGQSPGLLPAAIIMFLFGLPAGSLMASTRKDSRIPRMLKSTAKQMWWVFFPPALLPFLLAYL